MGGEHGVFVWSAYAVSAVVLAALMLFILLDWRRQRRQLDELERRGARRRAPASREKGRGRRGRAARAS